MERLTEKTIGCFEYQLKNVISDVKLFKDYDTFFEYNQAVKLLGTYEELDRTPEQLRVDLAELNRLKDEKNFIYTSGHMDGELSRDKLYENDLAELAEYRKIDLSPQQCQDLYGEGYKAAQRADITVDSLIPRLEHQYHEKAYYADYNCNKVIEVRAENYEWKENHVWYVNFLNLERSAAWSSVGLYLLDVNKYIFLTREAAEEALRKERGE